MNYLFGKLERDMNDLSGKVEIIIQGIKYKGEDSSNEVEDNSFMGHNFFGLTLISRRIISLIIIFLDNSYPSWI